MANNYDPTAAHDVTPAFFNTDEPWNPGFDPNWIDQAQVNRATQQFRDSNPLPPLPEPSPDLLRA